MANHKSAEKRIRQNEKRRAINRANRGRMRTEMKKLRSALALGDLPTAQELLPGVVSIIDKSIQKGVLHRNAAARYKSRLTTALIGLQATKQA
jgi:small subunit ribosomal protein S20